MPKLSPEGLEKGRQGRKCGMKRSTMVNKLAPTTTIVVGLASLAPGAAQAELIKWSFEGDFEGGAAATGTFFTNSSGAGTFNISDWNITTSGPPIFDMHGNITWDSTMPQNTIIREDPTFFVLENDQQDEIDRLFVQFKPPGLQNSPAEILVITEQVELIPSATGVFSRTGTTGSAIVAAPEPSTASVLGAGLLGLVFLWRRCRQILGL